MQVDPIKPTLKAPGTQRLKLIYNNLLSSFAFNFNLRRYNEADPTNLETLLSLGVSHTNELDQAEATGRGLHSFTFQLKLSTFCGIRGAFRGRLGGVRGW